MLPNTLPMSIRIHGTQVPDAEEFPAPPEFESAARREHLSEASALKAHRQEVIEEEEARMKSSQNIHTSKHCSHQGTTTFLQQADQCTNCSARCALLGLTTLPCVRLVAIGAFSGNPSKGPSRLSLVRLQTRLDPS